MNQLYLWMTVIGSLEFFVRPSAAVAKGSDKSYGLGLEAGANGNYGFMGIEGSILPHKKYDVHAGVGLLPSAAVGGGGVRYYGDPKDCFWWKNCFSHLFAGVNVSRTLSSQVTVKSDDGYERQYRIPKTTFLNATVGEATVLFGTLNCMLNVGYRYAVAPKNVEQVSGPIDEKQADAVQDGVKSGIQVSVSTGILF
jgi:hypothetical protein